MNDRWIIAAAVAVIAGSAWVTWKRVEPPARDPAPATARGPEIARHAMLPPAPAPVLETAPDGTAYQLVNAGDLARWLRAEAAQHRPASAWQDS